jgi:hypothetical protein
MMLATIHLHSVNGAAALKRFVDYAAFDAQRESKVLKV